MFSGRTTYRPSCPSGREALQPYYIDLIFTLGKNYKWCLDESGIPTRFYWSVGQQYSPTRIAAFALANWNAYLETENDAFKCNFLRQANWFVQHASNRAGGVVWEYRFDWDSSLKAPWISGMAQGEGISVLCRAYELTSDRQYLNIARRAARILELDAKEGGVLERYSDGGVCLEEYPYSDRSPSHVLNGFLYALFGLFDLARSTGGEGERFLDTCLCSLRGNLERYDLGHWSAYELTQGLPNPATQDYHDLHVAQLEVLHRLTGEEHFARVARRWRAYQKRVFNRVRALFGKARFRLRNPAPR
jgi:hypothetical protein